MNRIMILTKKKTKNKTFSIQNKLKKCRNRQLWLIKSQRKKQSELHLQRKRRWFKRRKKKLLMSGLLKIRNLAKKVKITEAITGTWVIMICKTIQRASLSWKLMTIIRLQRKAYSRQMIQRCKMWFLMRFRLWKTQAQQKTRKLTFSTNPKKVGLTIWITITNRIKLEATHSVKALLKNCCNRAKRKSSRKRLTIRRLPPQQRKS